MLFNYVFAGNTILSCYSFFLLIINLYFFIVAVIARTLNSIAEIVIFKTTSSKEVQAKLKYVQ